MTYQTIFLAEPGCQEYVKQEVEEKTAASTTTHVCDAVSADIEKDELIRMIYTGQTINNAFIEIEQAEFETYEDILNLSNEIDYDHVNDHLKSTYKVEVNRKGDHDFKSVDLEKDFYEEIKQDIESESKVRHPESIIHIEIRQNQLLIGIKLTKKDLSKRDYKLFNNPEALRGTIAASFLYFAKQTAETKCLDPFSTAGTIMIEAALKSSKRPVRYYKKEVVENINLPDFDVGETIEECDEEIHDEFSGSLYSFDAAFKNLSNQKKNSKIAGVDQHINFSRVNALQADLKFEKNEIDIVMTKLPEVTKRRTKEDVDELYDLMIYRFEYILKEDCRFCVIGKNPELFTKKAKLYGFTKTREKHVKQGRLDLTFTEYQR